MAFLAASAAVGQPYGAGESTRPPTTRSSSNPVAPGETSVEVENERAADVTVYLQAGDRELRLGVVPADSIMTFVIPRWLVSTTESAVVFVHPTGQITEDSGVLDIHPGEHFGIIVPAKRHGIPVEVNPPEPGQ
jgi:hypothetical protein